MKIARFGALAVAVFAMVCASMVKADEIEVQFSGVVTDSSGPAVSVGDSFSGYFTYSASDPFDILFLGQSEYSLTSPEDSESVSVDGIDVTVQPLTARLRRAVNRVFLYAGFRDARYARNLAHFQWKFRFPDVWVSSRSIQCSGLYLRKHWVRFFAGRRGLQRAGKYNGGFNRS
jgi:hypothetical protein